MSRFLRVSCSTTTDFLSRQNPLAGLSKNELFRNVENYAQKHDLGNILDLLKKGALVAQNPDHPETIGELGPEDVAILQDEKAHRWRHPKTLYTTVALNSIGAAIQGSFLPLPRLDLHLLTTLKGWDQTGSNGANLSFPQEFGIADTGALCESMGNCEKNSWIVGAINAAPYMALCVM